MKLILFFLMIVPASVIYAQDVSIKVSAGNNTIIASLDNKNDDKEIIIAKSTLYLNIEVANDNKDWKRDFYIVDDAGNDILLPVKMKESKYCSKISDLYKSLQVAKDYYLYTQSLPKDPKQAMLVKVPRKLVCKIKLVN